MFQVSHPLRLQLVLVFVVGGGGEVVGMDGLGSGGICADRYSNQDL
jgi:hypothetical protein